MIISTETVIGFMIPGEYEDACNFKKHNPDWKEIEGTQMIFYKKKDVYEVKTKEK